MARNRGCPCCASSGFNVDKSASCYYIKIESVSQILYKIGITNNKVKSRISGMQIDKDIIVTILQDTIFDKGIDARNSENNIKTMFSEFLYQGHPVMKNGNTELFTKDVLGLDI